MKEVSTQSWIRLALLISIIFVSPWIFLLGQGTKPSATISVLPIIAAIAGVIAFVFLIKRPMLSKWSWKEFCGFGALSLLYGGLFVQLRFGGAALGIIAPVRYQAVTLAMQTLFILFAAFALLQWSTCKMYRKWLSVSALIGIAVMAAGHILWLGRTLFEQWFVVLVQKTLVAMGISASFVHVLNVGQQVSVGVVTFTLGPEMLYFLLVSAFVVGIILWKHDSLSSSKTALLAIGLPVGWIILRFIMLIAIVLLFKNSLSLFTLAMDPFVVWIVLALYGWLCMRLSQ